MCLRTRSGTPGRLGVTATRAPCVVVRHVVEAGHVDATARGEPHQHLVATTGRALALPLPDDLADREHDLLAVAEHDGVDEVGDRLGVERRVAPGEHDRVLVGAVVGVQWDTREVERVQHVGVAQLGGERDAEDVEVSYWPVAVHRELRNPVLTHHRLHVGPDRVGPFCEHTLALVEDLVEDLHTLVRQAHLVRVGVHQRPTDVGLVPRLLDGVEFAADVLDGLAHSRQMWLERREDRLTS